MRQTPHEQMETAQAREELSTLPMHCVKCDAVIGIIMEYTVGDPFYLCELCLLIINPNTYEK